MKKTINKEKIEKLHKYCKKLSQEQYKDEYERGYNNGIEHIYQQLDKILFGKKLCGENSSPEFR